MRNHTLVIAYGNCLRGDDGVGPAAADVVRAWKMPDVKVLTVQQLLPELIDEIAQSDRVLFLDAASQDKAYACGVVEPKKSRSTMGHHETPANLLALLHDLEGRTPEAWLLTIAGTSFDHGEQVTESATANMQAALAWLRDWLLARSASKDRNQGLAGAAG